MADWQLREKIKKAEEAAINGEMIPERAKTNGFGCFIGIFSIAAVFVVAFAISMMMHDHLVWGFIALLVGIVFAYAIFQIVRADKLP